MWSPLTLEILQFYEKYKGSIDAFDRLGHDKSVNYDKTLDWPEISNLIQDIHIVKNGLASNDFAKELKEKIKFRCDKDETALYLFQLSDVMYNRRF